MPMPPYTILCYTPGCGQPAQYKIAARWSDGVTQELKTYGLTCRACLAKSFQQSRTKQAACRLTAAESLDVPGIYEMVHGCRDRLLQRKADLELELLAIT